MCSDLEQGRYRSSHDLTPSFPMLSVTLGGPLSESITTVFGWDLFPFETEPLYVVKTAFYLATPLPQPPVTKSYAIIPDLVWIFKRRRPTCTQFFVTV